VDEALYDQFADVGDTHWWFEGRRQVLAAAIEVALADPAMRPPGDQPLQILEVGCGTGANLGMLARFGSVHGLEMWPDAVETCRATFGDAIPVDVGAIPDDVPSDGRFDVVCAFDVIEHLDDDVAGLESMRRALRPGGTIVIAVPAFPILWGQQDELSHHRRRYRRKTLVAGLTRAGFAVERTTYFNTWLFPAAAVVRIARRIITAGRDVPPGSDLSMSNTTVDRILTKVFASERHLVRRWSLPFGVSLLAIARSPQEAP
jgi:SAM-dependent methyltransferase